MSDSEKYGAGGCRRRETKETDDSGRLYLGPEYADKRVTIAIVEVESQSSDVKKIELVAAYRDASENAFAFTDELDEASDEAWTDLDGAGTGSDFQE